MSTVVNPKRQFTLEQRQHFTREIRKRPMLGSFVDHAQFARINIYLYTDKDGKERKDMVYLITYPLSSGNPVCLPSMSRASKYQQWFGIFER